MEQGDTGSDSSKSSESLANTNAMVAPDRNRENIDFEESDASTARSHTSSYVEHFERMAEELSDEEYTSLERKGLVQPRANPMRLKEEFVPEGPKEGYTYVSIPELFHEFQAEPGCLIAVGSRYLHRGKQSKTKVKEKPRHRLRTC